MEEKYSRYSSLREISLAIARIVLGMVVLIGGLIALDIIIYISATGGTLNEKVAVARTKSREEGYQQTYGGSYQDAFIKAFDKGYEKGYQIGLGFNSKAGATSRVNLHNPTYKELTEFLAGDKTDSNRYVKGEYVCFDYAAELNNNAEANGIRAAYVRIHAKEWGHAIVAFETVDRGLVFIEPQSDKKVPDLVMGQPYPWHWVSAIRPMSYAEPIDTIQIIW